MNLLVNILIAFLVTVISFTGYDAQAQQVKVVKFDKLQQLRKLNSDTLYVVNFWATWCGPCIKELPYFEAVHKQYKGQPVRVVLVSMDAVQDVQKVKTFIQKRKLASDIWLLNETDANAWIDKLEPKWSGAIPATFLFNNKRKQYYFIEKELKENELQALIKKFKP